MSISLSTSAWIGISLGTLFVVIAGVNVILMLQATQPSRSPASKARLMSLHRLGGYAFLALFCGMFYYMNSRLLGSSDPLPFRLAWHVVLALLIVPILLLKIVIARRYKNQFGLLTALGITLFVLAFLLVAIGALPEIWKAVDVENIPAVVTVGVLSAIAVFCGILFWRRGSRSSLSPAAVAAPKKDAKLFRLARLQAQTHDAKTLRFVLSGNDPLAFRPGQFLTFRWMVDGKPVVRSYSICSSPSQSGYIEITVKRAGKGVVSTFLNERAELGLTVEARGPFGRFWYDERQHEKAVFIAGGSGITPFLSMLRHIDDRALKADVTLIYCVRTPQDVIFANELEKLRASLERFRCVLVASAPDRDWRGPSGRLCREILEDAVGDLRGRTFFLCGPPGLMESARGILQSMGVPDNLIRQESFGGKPAAAGAEEGGTQEGTVEFVRSRKSCAASTGRTLLEIAEKNGVAIPYSCRQGLCGTCAVPLLAGSVRMDTEDGLTAEHRASGCVLTCVGHPDGDVRLDV